MSPRVVVCAGGRGCCVVAGRTSWLWGGHRAWPWSCNGQTVKITLLLLRAGAARRTYILSLSLLRTRILVCVACTLVRWGSVGRGEE
ncbi:hypothetical protein PYCCODRAFT_546151 [Trametes coccinea BRFM310]|uniref:Uncharacterized protein n=1 Tax=Trametes coccinea (strain BRFM310) TaxID=1353009 RepID=A0A1Y2IJ12_TRAC3|nr:hypothetical protein PYCCODRAFT_546151 [Trametes coccinea BRFM310]